MTDYLREYDIILLEPDGVITRMRRSARRVEGWSKDYAFFNNIHDLSDPTFLIPRRLVRWIEKVDVTTNES